MPPVIGAPVTEPRDDRSTTGPAAEADDPAYLAARLAEAQDQLAATSEILSVLARASTSEDDVFEAVVEHACRLCRAQAAQIDVADGDGVPAGEPRRGSTRSTSTFAAEHPVPRDRGTLIGRVALDRRTQQIDDVLADPDYDLPEFQRLGGLPVDHRGADDRRRRGGRGAHRRGAPRSSRSTSTPAAC